MNRYIQEWFEAHADDMRAMKDDIWERPEVAFTEYYAAGRTAEFLRAQGFEAVEVFALESENGQPNCVRATYGSGDPKLLIMGETDALAGLGQDRVPYFSPKQGAGHGCGHNLMATGNAAAACAVMQAMKAENIPGTLVYLACPAEESLAGKAILAREGYFDGIDAAAIWHPMGVDMYFISGEELSATTNIVFEFTGKTAHAGMAWQGRSALDAAELMTTGVQYLREHVTGDCLMHHIFLDGGQAPNIVPETASVYFYLRSKEENNDDLVRRVKLVADGAATMTETSVRSYVKAGCHSYKPNLTMLKHSAEMSKTMPRIEYTPEEYDFAREMHKNVNGKAPENTEDLLPHGFMPWVDMPMYGGGSTDVGDAGMVCPTVQFTGLGMVKGMPNHHWATVAAVGTDIGLKGAIAGGEMVAQLIYDLFTDADLLAAAKKEFAETHPDPYVCKIPKNQ